MKIISHKTLKMVNIKGSDITRNKRTGKPSTNSYNLWTILIELHLTLTKYTYQFLNPSLNQDCLAKDLIFYPSHLADS